MGNAVSTPQHILQPRRVQTGADFVLGELGSQVVYDQSLGDSRFLKTIKARHKEGPLVIKVYVKPDPTFSLKVFYKRIKTERDALQEMPNLLPYERVLETETCGYLIRQYVSSNLYDRISTRPFLLPIEKKWIAYQLLNGLSTLHSLGHSHGEIKTENVLITSYLNVYLTDFSASYKPAYIPADDPSVFSYFFDTSGRRSCYLAPERFYSSDSEIAKRKESLTWGKRDGRVTEAMDVFAAGCVLAELWTEGRVPFTLSQMLAWREGTYDLNPFLNEIEDVAARSLITSMLSMDPNERSTCNTYLNQYRSSLFSPFFSDYWHPFVTSLPSMLTQSNMQLYLNFVKSQAAITVFETSGVSTPVPTHLNHLAVPGSQVHGSHGVETTLRSVSDEVLEAISSEWENIAKWLHEEQDQFNENGPFRKFAEGEQEEKKVKSKRIKVFPVVLHLAGASEVEVSRPFEPKSDTSALLILSLILANVRNTIKPSTTIKALDLLLLLSSGYLSDQIILDRVLPYFIVLTEDESPMVRVSVVRSITQLVLLVRKPTPANTLIFPEYIFPNTKALCTDTEIAVRSMYAACITELAVCAKRFLDVKEKLRTEGNFLTNGEEDGDHHNYDASLTELLQIVQDHLNPLLTDSSSVVRRALLPSMATLCQLFGKTRANDAVLAHLVTYLNTRDWMLRADWNQYIAGVSLVVGRISLEEYILPLVTMSLSDPEEFITSRVLKTITILAEKRMLTKPKIWELVLATVGFICHPNIWIREGTAAFLSTVSSILQATDKWCILYPTVKRLLRADIKDITDLAILDNAREPLSRLVFEEAVTWISKRKNYWPFTQHPDKRSEEEKERFQRLYNLGMKQHEDEFKINAMRDYITKLATARHSFPRSEDTMDHSGEISLQKLKATPQTIIFRIPAANEILDDSLLIPESNNVRKSMETSSPGSTTGVSGRQQLDSLKRRLAHTGSGLGVSLNLPMDTSISRAASTISITDASNGSNFGIPISEKSTIRTRIKSRIHLNAVDVGRAAPAIAQESVNAVGSFNMSQFKDLDSSSNLNAPSSLLGVPKQHPARFVSQYEGNDPHIKQLVERAFLDSYREALPELGPFVPAGVPSKTALRTRYLSKESRQTPEGKIIGNLSEHTGAITALRVASDQVFFVSGSEDGTIKVWDTIRLEKEVTSKSRQTFKQGGKITDVSIVNNSRLVVSASDNGSLWINRVEVTLGGAMPKYGKGQLVRQWHLDGEGDFVTCIQNYETPTSSNLILCSAQSEIVILSIQTMRTLQHFTNPIQFGPITASCMDPNQIWLVVGTARGVLSLWDLRFGLLLFSWTISKGRIHQISLHPTCGKSRWIVVVADESLAETDSKLTGDLITEVWNIETRTRVQEYRVYGPGEKLPKDAVQVKEKSPEISMSPADAIKALLEEPPSDMLLYALQDIDRQQSRTHVAARAFFVGPDYASGKSTNEDKDTVKGYLITGGEDRKLRFWDLERPEKSTIISGLDLQEEHPVFSTLSGSQSVYIESPGGAVKHRHSNSHNHAHSKVHRSTFIASSQHQILAGHRAMITAINVLDVPFRCVVSGDASGVIKVYE